jgi:hypothetical protein
MAGLPTSITRPTEAAISDYDLVSGTEPTIVALSGGKDSLVLALTLSELGHSILPVIIDMGYEPGWGARVQSKMRLAGVEAEVIDVRAPTSAPLEVTDGINGRLQVLDHLNFSAQENTTPCTYCYGVKALALKSAAQRHGVKKVALGQHHTDAAASLLKEALMHVDRWDRGHSQFARVGFQDLVVELLEEASTFDLLGSHPLLDRIAELVHAGAVDTDDPPRQPLDSNSNDMEIVRPMFLVDEAEIIATRDNMKLLTEGSGCGHGATLDTLTPRELVHFQVLRRLRNPAFSEMMSRLVMAGIDPQGFGTVRARHRRSGLLGDQYKPAIAGLDKL